ncbi:MAG: hypothetical protein COU31_02865 [Candidatus Magasanikbacteria bacterium CG10_big_fil_rev_8_21_14_0_10_40_10]|uniref:Uncharacterized protein n=1 Tax=Candidatus Magasanikbacteria bacterium CG10_big_fil_rev_8_21_14_0_10_40_10 TaxID=1974648 RepID=A0A2M6W420_9BACT|nr:MAG: hypothetical protein COU31_02865 [Candidatus Magasanikbacteria bacterium CG10_big_fil_rev_8_21_14_0_10_40_10]
MSKFTLQLYRHFYDNLPPLLPAELCRQIEKSLLGFEQASSVALEELENEIIKFGYNVWPYWQAYQEFMEQAVIKTGHDYVLAHLSDELKEKYLDLKNYGAVWHDFYLGRPAEIFESEHRVELAMAMVEATQKIKNTVGLEIRGLGREQYLRRVEDYNLLLQKIVLEVEALKKMAEQEKEHLSLAEQIRAKIIDIEHGLCFLGRQLEWHDIKNAREFFVGRRAELNRLKGIHIPKKIDFYGEEE